MDKKRSAIAYRLALLAIIAVQFAVLVWFGFQKEGFHEDEYYSYYSTFRTNGFYYPDREWVSTEEVEEEFMVLPEERFSYSLVKEVQSWDVHPPMYYELLETAGSLFPGVHSKWIGLGVNLFLFVLVQLALARLAFELSGSRAASLITIAFYGLMPATASSVMFLRMYTMLTLFVVLCTLFHIRLIKWEGESKSDVGIKHGSGIKSDGDIQSAGKIKSGVFELYLKLALTTYYGFLTQYLYIVYLFFIGAAYIVTEYCAMRKKGVRILIRSLFPYVLSQGIALILAVLWYPASVHHILTGYRGKEAQTEFLDVSNTWDRLRYFFRLLNEQAFCGMLPVLLIVLCALGVIAARKHRKLTGEAVTILNSLSSAFSSASSRFLVPAIAVIGFFFIIAKTTLILGDSSIRYELAICPILATLFISAFVVIAGELQGRQHVLSSGGSTKTQERAKESASEELSEIQERPYALSSDNAAEATDRAMTLFIAVLTAALLTLDLIGLAKGRVLFLYPEDAAWKAYATEQAEADTPALVVYNPDSPYKMWDIADILLCYPELYYVNPSNIDPITDDRISAADSLVIYLAECEDADRQLRSLMETMEQQTGSDWSAESLGERDEWKCLSLNPQ